MSTHTPQIRLAAARRTYEAAQERCPHWDEFGSCETACDCCYDLDDARREYRLAKRAALALVQS